MESAVAPKPPRQESDNSLAAMQRTRSGRMPTSGSFQFEESFWVTRVKPVSSCNSFARRISKSSSIGSASSLGSLTSPLARDFSPERISEVAIEADLQAAEEEDAELPPKGTILSSAVTLLLTSVGSGVFALPFAFSCAGAGGGAVLALAMAALSWASGLALSGCAQAAGVFSYEEIVIAAWGGSGSLFVEVSLVLVLLGAMAGVLTLISDALPALAQIALPQAASAQVEVHHPAVMTGVVLLVLLPLSCARSMHALRHVNTVGVVIVFAVCGYIARCGAESLAGGESLLAERPAYKGALGLLQATPIVMLSFCMHVQLPAVFGELQSRSLKRFGAALGIQTLACVSLYLCVGVCGLRLFGPDEAVPGDVLVRFGPRSKTGVVLRALVGLSCTGVFPLLSMPCRSILDHLLFGGGNQAAPAASGRHAAEATAVVLTAYGMAHCLTDLGKITAITGASGGALLCYVLPFLLFLTLHRGDSTSAAARWACVAGAVVAATLSVLALCVVVWRVAHD